MPPGRHRVVVLIEDAAPSAAWEVFVERTYGSLAASELARPPQGGYEHRDEIA